MTRHLDLPVTALTVKQPWAWAIMHDGKNVENRSWYTKHRGLLWIHAANTYDKTATIDGPLVYPTGALLGCVTVTGCVRDSDSEWADDGCWHWLLKDPVPLRWPYPTRGNLGLWTLPKSCIDHLDARGLRDATHRPSQSQLPFHL